MAANRAGATSFERSVAVSRRLMSCAILVLLAAAGIVCALTWPVVAVALALSCLVVLFALRVPALGFLGALAFTSIEGVLKARFSTEGVPSPATLVAAGVDLLLLGTFINLALSEHWRSARTTWARAGQAERVVWAIMLAWLAVSVLQIPISGDVIQGVKGFRLTQAYVPLVLGGLALFPSWSGREDLTRVLLWFFAIVAGYAALQSATGVPGWQEGYALGRTRQAELGPVVRDIGTFISPQELTSFLAPVAVFVLIVGFFDARLRAFAWVTFSLAMVALLESYVRIGLVAVGVGAAAVAGVMVFGSATARRTKVGALIMVIVIVAAGYVLALRAGGVSPLARTRSQGLSHPLSDLSTQIRLHTWNRSLRLAIHNPLGTGLGTLGHATSVGGHDRTYADSSYIKVLQEQGIFGVLFIIGVWGTVILLGRRLARAGPSRRPLAVASLGAFVAFLTICFVGEYIELPGKAIAWAFLGIAVWHAYGIADPPRTPFSSNASDAINA